MLSYEIIKDVFDLDNPLTVEYFELCGKDADEFTYFEKHHILPKSIWPKYKKELWNIVKLSYQNHFRAHELLAQIVINKRHQFQMLKAWDMMAGRRGAVHNKETYEHLKKLHRDYQSENSSGENNPMYGIPCSDERKAKISAANKGKVYPPKSEETRRKLSLANKGKKLSLEQVETLRKLGKERGFSEEARHRAIESVTRKPERFINYLKNNTNLSMLTEYVDMGKPILFKCDRGHKEFNRRPADIERGQLCTQCKKEDTDYHASTRVSKQEFESYLKEHTNLTLIEGFVNMKTKALFSCDAGHSPFYQKPSEIKRNKVCVQCKKKSRKKNRPVSAQHRENLSKAGRKPPEVFLEYLKNNTNLRMVSDYVKMAQLTWFQCDGGHPPIYKTPTRIKRGEVCKHCKKESHDDK